MGFSAENLPLLQQALTHPAFFEGARSAEKPKNDNQRLEFLGDAVLDLLVGEYLYHAYPDAREGDLSKMRAVIVCEASLAAQAQILGFGTALRLGRGSEASGVRKRSSVLADAFEAVVGAIFEVHGLDVTKQFIFEQFKERMDHLSADDYEDKKSLLQELVQKYNIRGVSYHLISSSGPDHAPCFETGVYCDKLLLGTGKGNSKKESEQAAAVAALTDKQGWLNLINTDSVN